MCVVQGFVISHPDGPIVVDTGVADDHDLINELYRPSTTELIVALDAAGIDERDVASDRRRVIDGDAEIAPGVSVMATPGHQSVVVKCGALPGCSGQR